MSEKPRKLRVFLCYTSADKPKVLELYQRLIVEDWIDPWLDVEKILPGQHWTSVIRQSLAEADSVIILISNNSINREGFVQREMNYAWDISLEKPRNVIYLIPLRLEDCEVPFDLRERQWADYFGKKQEETHRALLKSLRLRHEQKLRIEAEELSLKEKQQREIEKNAREKANEEFAKKAQLEIEDQIRRNAAKEKAERESAKKIAYEKEKKEIVEKARRLEVQEQRRQKIAREKAPSEVSETKKPLLPIEESLLHIDIIKGVVGLSVIIMLILMIILIYLGWHTQSLSSVPVVTPTSIPTGLFAGPTPTAGKPTATQTMATNGETPVILQSSTISTTPSNMPIPIPTGTRPATYILQADEGEWPYCIARRFDVDPDAMLTASGLTSPDVYYPGLKLVIPQSGSFPGARVLMAHPTTYTASAGETLYSIACKFGDVYPEAIALANNISISATLTAGQQIKIP